MNQVDKFLTVNASGESSEFAQLAVSIIENSMLNGSGNLASSVHSSLC